MRLIKYFAIVFFLVAASGLRAAPALWTPDLGNGRFKNPVLFLDYSDPDVIRVGSNFYLVASSFECVPGLPILHSKDLVNWEIVTYALPRLIPDDHFSVPHHGEGVWAPSIRFHAGLYYIYYPDPDYGIYVVTATDPKGPWSEPVLVHGGKGLIDPCPLWDDDGKVYLVHAWAASRGPRSNRLTVESLAPDGMSVIEPRKDVVDGKTLPGWTTIEGPKFYKRHGYYYIFAPAGGVTRGYQAVFRSKNVFGPYENRIVLTQGDTAINGPHQGAWVDTESGEDWFLHFQDMFSFGRVVRLEPMVWRPDDWPVIGSDPKDTGTGSPVTEFRKPKTAPEPIQTLPLSDEFKGPTIGLQWQWNANPKDGWYSLAESQSNLRLTAVPCDPLTMASAGNLLLQKFPGPSFTATTALDFTNGEPGEQAGLIVFGHDYFWVGLRKTDAGFQLVRGTFFGSSSRHAETDDIRPEVPTGMVYLRVSISTEAVGQFSWSRDATHFMPLGEPFRATAGRWVGAKVGVFAAMPQHHPGFPGFADFDWFRVTPVIP